jgi:competence protein ComEC
VTPGTAWLLAGALWTGCLLSGPWWLAVAAPGLALVAVRRFGLPLVLVALVMAGAGLAGGRGAISDGGLLPQLAGEARPALLSVTVASEPRETRRGAWFVVRVLAVDGHTTRERALVRVGGLDDAPEIGERLEVTASASPLEHDGLDGHARRLHASVALHVTRQAVTEPPGRLLRATTVARQRTRAAIDAAYGDDRGVLLAGLVLGDSSGRSVRRAEQFAGAGLSHLVVVSGRHVAVMLAGVLALTALLGVGARGRRWTCLLALGWFVLLVRWQPSVLRAGVMAALVLAAGLLGRGHDPRHTLAMAVVVLLLADPYLAAQPGFALSVLATAGVLVLAPPLAARLPGPGLLRLPVAVTVGAQLAAAPVLVGLQGGLPLGSVPANVAAVPAAALAQTVGLATAALAQAAPAAAEMVARAAAPALAVVLWAAETFSRGPLLRPGHLLTPIPVLAAAVLLARRRSPWVARCAAVTVAMALAVGWLRPPTAADTLTVTALDVGQGDALLVEIPGDPPARLLWDGGPDPDTVLRLLRERGVRRVDAVAMSHPHHDHVAGLPAVLDRLEVGALLVPPPAAEHAGIAAAAATETLVVAEQRGVPVLELSAGRRLRLGQATVEVLSPPADGWLAHDLNEHSLVLRIDVEQGAVLLTGDIETEAQRLLLNDPARLRADVLQVPHHGAGTSLPGFFAAVQPQIALIGVGEDNPYGHPHPATLLALRGVTVYRTDVHGTVRVEVGAGRIGHAGVHGLPTPGLPAGRLGGAAPAPRRRPAPRRAACRSRRARRHRPARGGRPRAGASGPAHGLAVRHTPSRRGPRGPGAARRGERDAPRADRAPAR